MVPVPVKMEVPGPVTVRAPLEPEFIPRAVD